MNTEALKELDNFNCTEHYYRASIFTNKFVYTDGVKFLCENADCFWLIDAIVSHQIRTRVRNNQRLQDFQVWTLKVNPDKSAVLTCVEDTGCKPTVTQKIPYTDFPLPEITLWIERGEYMTLCLPSEH